MFFSNLSQQVSPNESNFSSNFGLSFWRHILKQQQQRTANSLDKAKISLDEAYASK